MDFIDAKVETRIPAMQNELRSGLKAKVNVHDMDVALLKKADKETLEQVIERLNKMEEVSQRLASKLQAAGGEAEDEEVESGEGEDDEEVPGSPGSGTKRRGTDKGGGGITGVSKAALEELQNKLEDTEKKLMEMMQTFQGKFDRDVDEVKKNLDKNAKDIQRLDKHLEVLQAA